MTSWHESARSIKQLTWPTRWEQIFQRTAPLFVEIGFGNARYLVEMARVAPNANVIGIEISVPSIRNAERRLRKANIDNVALVRGNAKTAVWLLFEPASIEKVFINFPDPWPKAGHSHRRLISDDFLNLLATRMKPGAELMIATDHPLYAEWIHNCLSRSNCYTINKVAHDLSRESQHMRTKYEMKAVDVGRKCHYFRSIRNSNDPSTKYSIPEECGMPHVVLKTTKELVEISNRFEAFQWEEGDIRIRFIACYYSTKDNRLVFDVFLHEIPMEQRVLVSVASRKQGDLLISLHEVGFPRSTKGVHLAVGKLAEWLESLDDGTVVLRDNLMSISHNSGL